MTRLLLALAFVATFFAGYYGRFALLDGLYIVSTSPYVAVYVWPESKGSNRIGNLTVLPYATLAKCHGDMEHNPSVLGGCFPASDIANTVTPPQEKRQQGPSTEDGRHGS